MWKYDELFAPMKIGSCAVKNRYVMEPMGPAGLADSSGAFNDKAIAFYTERAKGGVGLIIAGMCYAENSVEWHAAGSMPCPTLAPVLFKRTAIQLTERVHAYGAKIFMQLSAGFGRVSNRYRPGDLPIAPSEIPYRWDPEVTCRAISTEEVQSIVRAMGQAATIAKASGFDGVEIHAMHEGYLIDQFAMECCNHRTDQYGGSLENRLRFAVEILQEIKKSCGASYPVVMRYSSKSFMKDFGRGALPGEEFREMGRDLDEGLEIARLLEQAGYDALDADVGCYDSWYWNHPPMYFEDGLYLPYNEKLKKAVSIPILTAGRLDNPDLALQAVKTGQTDFIGLARPLLADAHLVNKVAKNQLCEIRPCLSCQEGCIGRLKKYLHISCAVNPAACREEKFRLWKTDTPKRVAVIGGGVAGCEAARVLKLRGHMPELYEAGPRLGGKLHQAGAPDFKTDDRRLIRWYEYQIEKLEIPVKLNTRVEKTEELDCYDTVIVATGAEPIEINLGTSISVIPIQQIFEAPESVAEPVVIVGGGMVGCEAALMLKRMGKEVSIVEAGPSPMWVNGPSCYANKQMLLDLLDFYKIAQLCNAKAKYTVDTGLIVETQSGEANVPAETVALAIGYRGGSRLYQEFVTEGKEAYLLGEAKDGTGNILHSIWDAYEVAASL